MDLPNGKPEQYPDDTLAAAVDEQGKIVALIYSDETDVYVRQERSWVPLTENMSAMIDGLEWIDTNLQYIRAFDFARDADDTIHEDDLEQFRTDRSTQ